MMNELREAILIAARSAKIQEAKSRARVFGALLSPEPYQLRCLISELQGDALVLDAIEEELKALNERA